MYVHGFLNDFLALKHGPVALERANVIIEKEEIGMIPIDHMMAELDGKLQQRHVVHVRQWADQVTLVLNEALGLGDVELWLNT